MFKRNALLVVAGAAIFALDAAAASAQNPTSSKRIPIKKEAAGEVVATPRVDTVTVYKTDTLRLQGRIDTVTVTNTNTVTRVDTVIQSVPMTARHIGGMYVGLGGGSTVPYGSIRSVNEPGPVGQLQIGWQGLNSLLGFRVDGNYSRLAHEAHYAFMGPRPNMITGNADLRLDLPIFENTLGSSVRFRPYLIGGGSYVRYNNLRMKLDADGSNTNPGGIGEQHAVIAVDNGGTTTQTDAYHSDWGFNVGGGVSFHAGRKEMFFEGRGIRFTHAGNGLASSGAPFHAAWAVPLVFGVNLF